MGGVEGGDLDAAVGLAEQKALGDQDLGRGAKGVAGDAEAPCELGLAKPGPRLDLAVQDHLAEGVGGRLDGRNGRELEGLRGWDDLFWPCVTSFHNLTRCVKSTVKREELRSAMSGVERGRIAELMEREQSRFVGRASRVAQAPRARQGIAPRRRSDELDDALAGRVPGLRRDGAGGRRHRRRRQRIRRPLPRRHRRHDRPLSAGDGRGGPGTSRQGDHRDASDRGRGARRRGDEAPLRDAQLAVQPVGDRREPLRGPDRARDHRASQDPGSQPLLPRKRRRDDHDPRRRRGPAARGQRRRPGGSRRRPPGSSRSTTSTRSSASSPTRTWHASWSSPP